MKFQYCESLPKDQRVDENGNTEADNVNNNFISGTIMLEKDKNDGDDKPKKQVEQKQNRLQAMAMSDDEDYGELCYLNFVQIYFFLAMRSSALE
jgi:dTDP-D-glucose 4,6-dehydratase